MAGVAALLSSDCATNGGGASSHRIVSPPRVTVERAAGTAVTLRLEGAALRSNRPTVIVAVARNLTWLLHAAASSDASGVYRVSLAPPNAAAFTVFAIDSDTTVAARAAQIGEADPVAQAAPVPMRTITWRGYRVELSSLTSSLTAGRTAIVSFSVRREDGRPVTVVAGDVAPLALAEDATALVVGHRVQRAYVGDTGIVHEDVGTGDTASAHGEEVQYHLEFPAAGRYSIWPLMRIEGAELDAPFVVDVQP